MDIHNLRSDNRFPETARFVLVCSCNVHTDGKGVALNQKAIGDFLGISLRTTARDFEAMKDNGFVTVIGKERIRRKEKGGQTWDSNLYKVDKERINQYLIEIGYGDVIGNMEEESKLYYDFLTYVHTAFVLNKTADNKNAENGLTEEEVIAIKKEIEKKVKRKQQRDKKKMDKLRNENEKYLNELSELNETSSIPMYYLDENRKRLTNPICVTKNPQKHPNDPDSGKREEMLRDFLGTNKNIVEFDTNASIYRLSYALGNGEIARSDVDMYEVVYNACGFNAEWTKELRNMFKPLLMTLYMGESSIKHNCRNFDIQRHWKSFYSQQVETRFMLYKYFVDLFELPLYEILTTVCNAMHEVFNLEKFFKGKIFIHESNLHIIMLRIFKENGIKTINVYDGFYFIEGEMNQEFFDEVYIFATIELLEDYNIKS